MLKLPFQGRLPKYQKFNFEARYYDPIKEEIASREKEIRKEIEHKESSKGYTGSFIEDNFQRRSSEVKKTSGLQIIIMLVLLGISVLYLYF